MPFRKNGVAVVEVAMHERTFRRETIQPVTPAQEECAQALTGFGAETFLKQGRIQTIPIEPRARCEPALADRLRLDRLDRGERLT